MATSKRYDDLLEFYEHWPELRQRIHTLLDDTTLSDEDKSIIKSMAHVVDCVGPADLQPDTTQLRNHP